MVGIVDTWQMSGSYLIRSFVDVTLSDWSGGTSSSHQTFLRGVLSSPFRHSKIMS